MAAKKKKNISDLTEEELNEFGRKTTPKIPFVDTIAYHQPKYDYKFYAGLSQSKLNGKPVADCAGICMQVLQSLSQRIENGLKKELPFDYEFFNKAVRNKETCNIIKEEEKVKEYAAQNCAFFKKEMEEKLLQHAKKWDTMKKLYVDFYTNSITKISAQI